MSKPAGFDEPVLTLLRVLFSAQTEAALCTFLFRTSMQTRPLRKRRIPTMTIEQL
jgi:hypothetical protein